MSLMMAIIASAQTLTQGESAPGKIWAETPKQLCSKMFHSRLPDIGSCEGHYLLGAVHLDGKDLRKILRQDADLAQQHPPEKPDVGIGIDIGIGIGFRKT